MKRIEYKISSLYQPSVPSRSFHKEKYVLAKEKKKINECIWWVWIQGKKASQQEQKLKNNSEWKKMRRYPKWNIGGWYHAPQRASTFAKAIIYLLYLVFVVRLADWPVDWLTSFFLGLPSAPEQWWACLQWQI